VAANFKKGRRARLPAGFTFLRERNLGFLPPRLTAASLAALAASQRGDAGCTRRGRQPLYWKPADAILRPLPAIANASFAVCRTTYVSSISIVPRSFDDKRGDFSGFLSVVRLDWFLRRRFCWWEFNWVLRD
jgi:hypothetical protein